MDDFKLLNKSKLLLKYIVNYILIGIPKVHSSYRKGLEDNVIDLNSNIIRANINVGNIRNKYQKEVLVNISMIDFELQNQINSANTTTTVPTGESATYKMTATVRIRTGAGTSNSQTKFADLSDDVKKVASDDGGVAFMAAGTVFTASESKEDSDKNVWVKLADNAWVCVKFGDATWATKQ